MRRCGYEPQVSGDAIRLRNCPFDALAEEHRELVCGMNLAFVRGLVEGAGAKGSPVLDPQPDECCVAVVSAKAKIG